MQKIIVAIDGYAATGKSSQAKRLAKTLGYTYIDTGALYRVIALALTRLSLEEKDLDEIQNFLSGFQLDMRVQDSQQLYFLDGKDVSEAIRTESNSCAASRFAALDLVRSALIGLQRQLAAQGDAVVEGRDMGTVIFPEAELKVFLTASAEVRAERRYLQLLERGSKADRQTVLEEILDRDSRDKGRAIAPLKAAEDAVILDSSQMSQGEVVANIIRIFEEIS